MLSDTVDMENMIFVDTKEQAGAEMELLIDADENNYSLLREQQRRGLHKSKRQQHTTSLAQNDQAAVENQLNANTGKG